MLLEKKKSFCIFKFVVETRRSNSIVRTQRLLMFLHSPAHFLQVRKNRNPSAVSRPPVRRKTTYNKKTLYNFRAKKLFVGHPVYACVYQLPSIDLNQRRIIRFAQANSWCYRLQARSERNRVNLIIDEVLSDILSCTGKSINSNERD